jgi:hypothetical protein
MDGVSTPYPSPPGSADQPLSPLDLSVVGSFKSAEFARHGARLLRYAAGLIAVFAIVGHYLVIIDDEYEGLSGGRKIGYFLSSAATPLAIAALVAAASLVITAYVAGIELGSVGRSVDEDDTGSIDLPLQ